MNIMNTIYYNAYNENYRRVQTVKPRFGVSLLAQEQYKFQFPRDLNFYFISVQLVSAARCIRILNESLKRILEL